MKFSKKHFFIPLFSIVFGAQVVMASQPSPTDLNIQTVYSGAAITIGANSVVHGNLQAFAAVTLGASAIVEGDLLSGAAVTLGADGEVGGDLAARDAGTIGADATIGNNLTTGDAATLGATTEVGGNLTAGGSILVGVGSTIIGDLTSGAAADLGANASVGGKAIAGTALTLGADTTVGGDAVAGTGALALGARVEVLTGTATGGTIVTVGTNAIVRSGLIYPGNVTLVPTANKAGIDDKKAPLTDVQKGLADLYSPAGNELSSTMVVSTRLAPGVYHATALTTTAGITLTLDGTGNTSPVAWVINVDTFINFGANLTMELEQVPPGSTIIFNAGGYTAIGANSIVKGKFYAGTYITTGAGAWLTGSGNNCGGMFTTNGAITLGASNTIGAPSCQQQGAGSGTQTVAQPPTTPVTNNAVPSVNLGVAGEFVILTKTGISTTGVTAIKGNIGVSPIALTAITGFDVILHNTNTYATSALVQGKIYAADMAPPTPAMMTAAIGDMETAYTDVANRAPDNTEFLAGRIGGQTLPPATYKWGTNVWINTDITLSGTATDVWVFQISGDLILANGQKIILANGAEAKNVFWQVAGGAGVSLGTTSVFEGVVLAHKKIVVRTGATVNGRLLSQTAVTLDANYVEPPGQ
jgi:predicted acyltransferase (DUF342 family)